jgi:hypothetical protein
MSLLRDIAEAVKDEEANLWFARKVGNRNAERESLQVLNQFAIQLTIMIQKRGKDNVVRLENYRRQA